MIKIKQTTKYLMQASIVLNLIILGLLIGCFVLQITKEKQIYGVEAPDGSRFRIKGLAKPSVSPDAINSWAQLAITKAYTMDFLDYEKTLNDLKQYFTPSGYKVFLNALESSERLKDIKEKKLRTSAVVAGSPMIIEGLEQGKHTWNIQIPMLLSYEGASEQITTNKTVVILKVVTAPISEVETGIGISKISQTSATI